MSPSPGIEDLLRGLAPQVLGSVIRQFGDYLTTKAARLTALRQPG